MISAFPCIKNNLMPIILSTLLAVGASALAQNNIGFRNHVGMIYVEGKTAFNNTTPRLETCMESDSVSPLQWLLHLPHKTLADIIKNLTLTPASLAKYYNTSNTKKLKDDGAAEVKVLLPSPNTLYRCMDLNAKFNNNMYLALMSTSEMQQLTTVLDKGFPVTYPAPSFDSSRYNIIFELRSTGRDQIYIDQLMWSIRFKVLNLDYNAARFLEQERLAFMSKAREHHLLLTQEYKNRHLYEDISRLLIKPQLNLTFNKLNNINAKGLERELVETRLAFPPNAQIPLNQRPRIRIYQLAPTEDLQFDGNSVIIKRDPVWASRRTYNTHIIYSRDHVVIITNEDLPSDYIDQIALALRPFNGDLAKACLMISNGKIKC